MEDTLILDIEKAADMFDMNKILIFINKKCPIYSLASGFALQTYLHDLGYNAGVVLKKDDENTLLQSMPSTVNEGYIKPCSNDFIAVVLDAENEDLIESDKYKDTYILFEVRGGSKTRDYGVKSYNDRYSLCSAEILYHSFRKYEKEKNVHYPDAYGYIYLSLIDITSNFHKHMRSDTFKILKELNEVPVDSEYYDYAYNMHKIEDLRILQSVYTRSMINDRIALTIFDKNTDLCKLPVEKFRSTLSYIRYIDDVDIWFIFIEQENGKYTTLIQGNNFSSIDISKIASKNGGTGSKKKGICTINEDEMSSLIDDVRTMRRHQNEKLKVDTKIIKKELK